MKASRYVFLLCSLAVCGAPAQDSPQNPSANLAEITSHQAPATFSSKVNLVSVPVVVRDSKGRAVGGLRQEDFRLFDKGKLQVITKFSIQQNPPSTTPGVVAAGARPAENTDATLAPLPAGAGPSKPVLPDHYVAYIFDDIHLQFGDLGHMRAAMEQHFAQSLAPSSRTAIFTTSGRVWLDFTDDRQKLHEALLRIGVAPSAMPPVDPDSHDPCPPKVSHYQADAVLNGQDPNELKAVAGAVNACFGNVPEPQTALGYSQGVLNAGNADTQNNLSSLAELVRRLSAMPGSRSIVLVSSGFFVTSQLRQTEAELTDAAIRANVTLNGLDARGRYTTMTAEADAQGDAMRRLADGTGGKFFEHDNGFKEGFDQLATPPEYTYVLGFSPQNLKFDGSYHGLKVRLVNSKGLDLQARQGYWAPNHAEDAAEQAKEEIREAVFSMEEVRDIPVDVTTEFFKSSDATAELTVEAHLHLNGLKFRTAGDRNEDTLTVVTGLFDRNGRYVKGIQRVIDLRLREQTLEKVLGSGMAVKETFDIAPGRYVVRVVVRDSEGQTMAARNGTVDIR
jgi:VWFA-related protein